MIYLLLNNNIENNPLQDSIEMYRGMSLDINTLASLKKGNIFEPKSILSMSTNEKIAKKYMNYAKERGKNNVLIKNVPLPDLDLVIQKLKDFGVKIEKAKGDRLRVSAPKKFLSVRKL